MGRAWVRSEYAGELAVVLTWASAVIPWSVSLSRYPEGVTFVVVRFPFFMFQFLYGIRLRGAERPFLTVVNAPGFPDPATQPDIVLAYRIWQVGAVVLGLAVLYSVAYYAAEERVESGPVDPVRALGGALVVCAVVLSVSTGLLVANFAGISVPVGVLFLYLFGGLLLTVDRT